MGLIGRSVYGEMELVNIQPDITVSVHSHAACKLSGAGKTHTSGVLGNCVMSLLFFYLFFVCFTIRYILLDLLHCSILAEQPLRRAKGL